MWGLGLKTKLLSHFFNIKKINPAIEEFDPKNEIWSLSISDVTKVQKFITFENMMILLAIIFIGWTGFTLWNDTLRKKMEEEHQLELRKIKEKANEYRTLTE